MPAILDAATYDRWLGSEPDPRELLFSYPPAPMTMWPIASRVNSPNNDDLSLLNRAADASNCGRR
jgi:putative SOS response-associated peptidase YedK